MPIMLRSAYPEIEAFAPAQTQHALKINGARTCSTRSHS
jgi:hypothetical protein